MTDRQERIVISAMGANRSGIIARISRVLADHDVDIIDITQKIVENLFVMMLIADVSKAKVDLDHLSNHLQAEGKTLGLQVAVQHERLFRYMHRV